MYQLDAVKRLEAVRATGLLDGAPPTSFDDLTALAVHLLRVPMALISVLDAHRQVFVSQRGLPAAWAARGEAEASRSLCRHVVAADAPLLVTDARDDARLDRQDAQDVFDALGVVAYAGAPIHSHDQPVGVVCVVDVVPRTWTAEELQLLTRLAALTSRELERAAPAAQPVVSIATHAAPLVAVVDSLRAVLDSLDDSVAVTDATGALVLSNPAAARVFGAAATLDRMSDADGVTPIPYDDAPMACAVRGEVVRGRELALRDTPTDQLRWHSISAVPVRDVDGTILGAVAVGRDITRLKHAQRELERTATRDELTGTCNRRGVLEHAELALRRADRTGRPVALIYLDLDGFKAINDRLGHATGDLALTRFAVILRDTFRAADVIGRLGGDEFVVVASDYDDDDDGAVIRGRLVAALEAANRTTHLPFRLAASAGIVVYRPGAVPQTLDQLLALADHRMYEAKRARRGRRGPGLLTTGRRARRRGPRRRAAPRTTTTPPRLRRDSAAA